MGFRVQPLHYQTDLVRVRKLCVGPYENNAYVVSCVRTGAAVLIDAAAEPSNLMDAVSGTDLIGVLTTHGHSDHVGAAAAFVDVGIPVHINEADAQVAAIPGLMTLEPGTRRIGEIELTAVHTPGHTPGSMCFLIPGLAFTGDTLFPGGPGATRFPGSSFEQIIASISQTLLSLDDDTLVLPGHGLDTTIGEERPHLSEWIARGW